MFGCTIPAPFAQAAIVTFLAAKLQRKCDLFTGKIGRQDSFGRAVAAGSGETLDQFRDRPLDTGDRKRNTDDPRLRKQDFLRKDIQMLCGFPGDFIDRLFSDRTIQAIRVAACAKDSMMFRSMNGFHRIEYRPRLRAVRGESPGRNARRFGIGQGNIILFFLLLDPRMNASRDETFRRGDRTILLFFPKGFFI